ncbi:MAG TPA: hypothetical protein DIT25_04550 [Candidatus Moranbacteria bacterium]|nr:hypothetical protein [Candidatus Moranbacteria bacterium]
MKPIYNLDKIKFATDGPTFEKAVGLYEKGKVMRFKEELNGFLATVSGTKPYSVYVDRRQYDQGDCDCYLGQNNTLCKHMVAVAIYAAMDGKPLANEDRELIDGPTCSGKLGEMEEEKLAEIKRTIAAAMKYIKAYSGPSRTWFAYQGSLSEGCARLSKIVSDLPVSRQAAKILVEMLLRLDKKICNGGVDDSDGTVGGFIEEVVIVLEEYVRLNPECIKSFEDLCGKSTCFGWEEPLVKIFDDKS